MKTLLLSATALIGLTAGAMAADLPSRHAAPPVIAPVPLFTWTGFYAGVQVGGAWGNNDGRISVFDLGSVSGDADMDGVVGGAHVGFNYQLGQFVVGVEGDFEGASLDGKLSGSNILLPGDSFEIKSEIDWQGSIRGRFGVAFDRALIYATGGAAFANIAHTFTAIVPPNGFGVPVGTFSEKFEDTEWGWTVGGGVEYAFIGNLTARVEYRFTRFDNVKNTSAFLLPGAVAENDLEFHTVRAGLSYKF